MAQASVVLWTLHPMAHILKFVPQANVDGERVRLKRFGMCFFELVAGSEDGIHHDWRF